MSAPSSPANKLLRVIQVREEIDRVATTMIAPNKAFGDVSLPIPRLDPAELGFIRSVAYTFVLYYEAGEVSVPYLVGLLDAFGLDGSRTARGHRARVGRLRTYLQHNLNPASSTDRETKDVCERWFAEQCGTRVPSSDDEWSACLDALLDEACAFLSVLRDCLRALEADEGREIIAGRWLFRISRYHPPEAFDDVISEAANDLGREHLDVTRFRKRFYDQWMERLSRLTGEYDFHLEARRLVEASLIVDAAAGMPITGIDVINDLGVPPGPLVADVLGRARRLFEAEPSNREALLARLREELTREAGSPGEVDSMSN